MRGRIRFVFPTARGRYLKFNFILALALCTTMVQAQVVTGVTAAKPTGELVDVQPLSNDDALMCSFYLTSKKKTEIFLSRTDGKRHLKKQYWTSLLVKQGLAGVNGVLKGLSGSTGASKKKADKLKQDLLKLKKQFKECSATADKQLVLFKHVRPIIETTCMQCHSPLGWKNEEQYFLSTTRVVPGKLDESSFYTFLSNNPEGFEPAYMPKGTAPLSDFNLKLLARWINDLKLPRKDGSPTPSASPTPNGEVLDGKALYKTYCASCHGEIEVSTKYGRTEAQIRAAIGAGGTPQMRYLKLTDEQIHKIALALSAVKPPEEGTITIKSLGNVAEGNSAGPARSLRFEVSFAGNSSQPFTVGYATSNGSALADSDFIFNAGTLHFQGTNGEKLYVDVTIIGDSYQEGDESLYLDIGGLSYGGVRIETSTASGTILNDDTYTQTANPPPQSANLRVAYPFNGDFKDILGIADAIPQGDVVLSSSAKLGSGSVEFDDATDHLLVPGFDLQGMSNFSFSSWVFWADGTSTTSRIFDFGSTTTNYIFFSPRDSTNRCRFEVRTPSGTFIAQCVTNVTLPVGRWVHLVTTFNPTLGEMKIYFDGALVATRTAAVTNFATLLMSDNKLGKSRVVGSTDFAGKLDEVAAWNSALTAAEVSQLFAMNSSMSLGTAFVVRVNGDIVRNGSTLDLGSVEVGKNLNLALTVTNAGLGALGFMGDPLATVAGKSSSEFKVRHNPWPWQKILGNSYSGVFAIRYAPTSPGDKVATLIIPNSDPQEGNFAIALTAKATGDALPEPSPPSSGDSPLAKGQFLYASNCSSCHGLLGQSQKLGTTVEKLTAAINPTTGIAQMRSLVLSSDEIQQIVLALNSPAPDAAGSDKVTNAIATIGTAKYVASALQSVFLPEDSSTYTADDTTIATRISENILGLRLNGTFIGGRISYFGGRCDLLEDNCQVEARDTFQSPSPNSIRSALIIRTCDEVLSLDRAIDNALSQVGRTTSSPIDMQAMKDVYQLFFPGREPPSYLGQVVANMSRGLGQLTQKDHWRFQLHLICTSTDWEVL